MAMTFYNPHNTALKIDVSLSSCSLQLTMALPHEQGQVRTKYHWEDGSRAVFSLSPAECSNIMQVIDKIVLGQFKNNDPKCDPKYTEMFSIAHYPQNDGGNKTASRIIFSPGRDKDKNLNGSLMIKIMNPGLSGNYFHVLKRSEFTVFKGFIYNTYMNLPFLSCFYGQYGAISRLERKENYDNKDGGNRSQAPRDNNQGYGGGGSNVGANEPQGDPFSNAPSGGYEDPFSDANQFSDPSDVGFGGGFE